MGGFCAVFSGVGGVVFLIFFCVFLVGGGGGRGRSCAVTSGRGGKIFVERGSLFSHELHRFWRYVTNVFFSLI